MAQRRWEELDSDCLTNVFGRVGMESLLVDIPFVCKSWHKASHDPSCWLSIDFPNVDYYLSVPVLLIRFEHNYKTKEWPAWSRVFLNGLVKIVIERSKGKATCLKLPGWCSKEALKLVAPEFVTFPLTILTYAPTCFDFQYICFCQIAELLFAGGLT